MDDECPYTEEELLVIHAEAERVERPWRIAVRVMYSGVAIVCISVVAGGLSMAIHLLIYGGGPTPSGILWGTFLAAVAAIFVGAGMVFAGAAVRPLAAKPIARFSKRNKIGDLPAAPPPQLDERFGHHRVLISTPNEMLLAQRRYVVLVAVAQAVGAALFGAFIGTMQVILASSGLFWRVVWAVPAVAGVIACIAAMANPVPVQWLIARDHDRKARMTVENVRLIFFRSAIDIAASVVYALHVEEGKLYLYTQNGSCVLLATVGFGDFGEWRTRRLIAAVCSRLGISREDLADVVGEED